MTCRICGADSGGYLYCVDHYDHYHDDTPAYDDEQDQIDYEEREEAHG